jgi:hypothetical protein
VPWNDKDIGPFNPPPRVDWKVIHYIYNSPPQHEKDCLTQFLEELGKGGPVTVSCDDIGGVTLVRRCGHIMEMGGALDDATAHAPISGATF